MLHSPRRCSLDAPWIVLEKQGMDIKHLTPAYAVSPQIAIEDLTFLADAGFRTVVNNRPDYEIPGHLACAEMRAAAKALGLAYVDNPVDGRVGITPDMIDAQKRAVDEATAPVFAYCASGTRSTIVWMIGQAPNTPSGELIAAAAAQGYDLAHMQPMLDSLYQG